MAATTSTRDTRETRRPSRYNDCLTGTDLETILSENDINNNHKDKYESPLEHAQVDGGTNTVTFYTTPQRMKSWKNAIELVFGKEKTTFLKNNSVVKIICDVKSSKNCKITINFYEKPNGSIVIQGSKCVEFKDTFFDEIQKTVNFLETATTEDSTEPDNTVILKTKAESDTVSEIEQTHDENSLPIPTQGEIISETTPKILELQNNTSDDSITFLKPLQNTEKTSTPKISKHNILSPKERVKEHSHNINAKLDSVTNTLCMMDDTMKNFSDLINDVKSGVDKSSIDTNKPETGSTNQKLGHIKDQIKIIESKILHCNQLIDSLHTKLNIVDGQNKDSARKIETLSDRIATCTQKIVEFQTENNEATANMMLKISEMHTKLEELSLR